MVGKLRINTKSKTFIEYEKIIRNHLQPLLGNILLNNLRSIQLRTIIKRSCQYYPPKSSLAL
ncbi:hypothetical protein LG336_05810 [Mesobacillus maritimus]